MAAGSLPPEAVRAGRYYDKRSVARGESRFKEPGKGGKSRPYRPATDEQIVEQKWRGALPGTLRVGWRFSYTWFLAAAPIGERGSPTMDPWRRAGCHTGFGWPANGR